MNIAWFNNNLYLTKEVEKKKKKNIINTHSLIQSSCSTCCYCITVIIHSAHVYITSHHYFAVLFMIHRTQSEISQSGNEETTGQVKMDFMSRGRSHQ